MRGLPATAGQVSSSEFLLDLAPSERVLVITACKWSGKSEIVDNLAHLWMAAERLLGRPCDPLDEELVALMERELG